MTARTLKLDTLDPQDRGLRMAVAAFIPSNLLIRNPVAALTLTG